VARKFSTLANLDVENIPAEKEAKVKEQIISSRFKRNVVKWSSALIKISKAISQKASIFFKWIFDKLYELRDNYKSETVLLTGDKEEKVKELFLEVEELEKQGELKEAEKRLIEIIGFDSKNIKAFEILGRFYFEDKNYEESKQTFEHILKLIGDEEKNKEKLAEIYFNLALVGQATENFDEAWENLKRALEIEPNNPRYLDIALEISIIKKDKVLALDAYEKLKNANPDNQKLKEFKKQIKEL